jgi:hypothetical protein
MSVGIFADITKVYYSVSRDITSCSHKESKLIRMHMHESSARVRVVQRCSISLLLIAVQIYFRIRSG